ncbi:esterase/lipase family protein [Nocardia africana]|uniref:Esterase/lipase family protein n=1 Tax=Nocardia africana TaxID=134964 RepID=A0ABW6NAV3_9NOCA
MSTVRFATISVLLCALIAVAAGRAPRAHAFGMEVPPLVGANDFSCRPSRDKPYPVILAHGAATDAQRSFGALAPALRSQGYCVFAADVGRVPLPTLGLNGVSDPGWPGLGPIAAAVQGDPVYGVADIGSQAVQLATFVAMVRGVTGAPKVEMVGHSTGGTEIREYVRRHPGVVDSVVTIGTPYRGSTFDGLPKMFPFYGALGMDGEQTAAQVFGPAGAEQVPGTPTLTRLNADGETEPGIRYTAIASRTDEVITPAETALLARPEGGNRNIWIQDGCPALTVSHNELLSNPRAIAEITAAVAGAPPPPPC